MTHGALFNGIAGFPLAAAWAGIETTWTCEIDEFCNKVSKKHFPNAIQYTDIRAAKHLPYVDIISGGFPCQPFSLAGKMAGKNDNRYLWPEMLRIIREVGPAYVIGENVAGIISLALDEVLTSLETEGYTTETFIVPAAGVGAQHKRDRVWIIAYTNSSGWRVKQENGCNIQWDGKMFKRERIEREFSPLGNIAAQDAPNPNGESGIFLPRYGGQSEKHPIHHDTIRPDFRFTESPVCGPDDGVSSGMVRNRSAQLKAYGNAIVPHVAYQFFKAIKEIESARQSSNQAA